jgi:hypothetical protein
MARSRHSRRRLVELIHTHGHMITSPSRVQRIQLV